MIIEEIFNDVWKRRGKITILFLGILMTIIGFAISYILFQGQFLPIVFFTTLALVPFVKLVFKDDMKTLDITLVFFNLFIGMILVFIVIDSFFDIGSIVSFSLNIGQPYVNFSSILIHNTKLVFTSFLLSILFGIGAIFILTLNAAVIGQMFSTFFAANKMQYLLAFLPHTAVEFAAYLLAAVSGGLLVRALTNKNKKFEEGVLQAAAFFSVSITAVILAAFLESFIMPVLAAM